MAFSQSSPDGGGCGGSYATLPGRCCWVGLTTTNKRCGGWRHTTCRGNGTPRDRWSMKVMLNNKPAGERQRWIAPKKMEGNGEEVLYAFIVCLYTTHAPEIFPYLCWSVFFFALIFLTFCVCVFETSLPGRIRRKREIDLPRVVTVLRWLALRESFEVIQLAGLTVSLGWFSNLLTPSTLPTSGFNQTTIASSVTTTPPIVSTTAVTLCTTLTRDLMSSRILGMIDASRAEQEKGKLFTTFFLLLWRRNTFNLASKPHFGRCAKALYDVPYGTRPQKMREEGNLFPKQGAFQHDDHHADPAGASTGSLRKAIDFPVTDKVSPHPHRKPAQSQDDDDDGLSQIRKFNQS